MRICEIYEKSTVFVNIIKGPFFSSQGMKIVFINILRQQQHTNTSTSGPHHPVFGPPVLMSLMCVAGAYSLECMHFYGWARPVPLGGLPPIIRIRRVRFVFPLKKGGLDFSSSANCVGLVWVDWIWYNVDTVEYLAFDLFWKGSMEPPLNRFLAPMLLCRAWHASLEEKYVYVARPWRGLGCQVSTRTWNRGAKSLAINTQGILNRNSSHNLVCRVLCRVDCPNHCKF